MESRTTITSIIIKALSGTASLPEQIFLDQWLDENPENVEEFNAFKLLWSASRLSSGSPAGNEKVTFNKIRALFQFRRCQRLKRQWTCWIAATLALLGLTIAILQFIR
jgi:ferric-dicitrate binding protein FerR (iron transport regulator)